MTMTQRVSERENQEQVTELADSQDIANMRILVTRYEGKNDDGTVC